ncbi:MAG TPA: hypothetical protein DCX19_04260 [Alphaproteobacteria bacterium]|nr:hypothetical protein [Alphaproteobacteria bacterium]
MNKMKNFVQKIGLTAFAVMALPMAARAEGETTAMSDMVNKLDVSDVKTAVLAGAAILLGLLVVKFGAKFVMGLFGR